MKKPTIKLEDDENVFGLIQRVKETLMVAGLAKEAAEFEERAMNTFGIKGVMRLAVTYLERLSDLR